jgi:hypothetical protein
MVHCRIPSGPIAVACIRNHTLWMESDDPMDEKIRNKSGVELGQRVATALDRNSISREALEADQYDGRISVKKWLKQQRDKKIRCD